jgi:tRNA-modifying protein YgfZ
MAMNESAYHALRERAAYIDLTGRGQLRATGEDRARLLHAMTTNHIEQLQPGTGCYAFFLTSQGRILSDVNVFCMPDYFLLDTEPETKERVRGHLDKYIIADDVTLNDFTDATATIYVEGPAATEVLSGLGAPAAHVPYAVAESGHNILAHVSYTGGPGYAIFTPVDEKTDVIAHLGSAGVTEARLAEIETVRLENGRPRYGVDFSEVNIPQETQQIHAVHSNKGCYLGQEIVERVRSRGHVNRVLTRLELDTAAPPARGAKVQAGDSAVGEISSAAYSPAFGCTLAFSILRAEALTSVLTVDGVSAKVRREQQSERSGSR